MSHRSRPFGTLPDGRPVTCHVLESGGVRVELLDLGAIINSLVVDGHEVAVGFDDLDEQQAAAEAYFGAVVGRYANRLAAGGFHVDGTRHQVTQNEGTTALHGGVDGFDARTWTVVEAGDDVLTLQLTSPDGDQGFPGELVARATYRLVDDGLRLELSATTSAPTVCALTSHLYVNLAGGGSVHDHLLTVPASRFVTVDEASIPLGELAPVDGTPFDLRRPTLLGDAVRVPHQQVLLARGIDHSFDVDGTGLRPVARLECPAAGVTLELASDQPALQVYTGNFLDGTWSSRGRLLRQGDAMALEPHVHPDSPNQSWSGPERLLPGEVWASTIEWRVRVD